MTPFETNAQELIEAASRHDRLAAWEATGRLISHLSSSLSHVDDKTVFQLVWGGAAKHRWFDIAEILAGAVAARPDATPSARRLHAQMLMERGFAEEALSRLRTILQVTGLPQFDRGQAYGHIGRIYKDRFIATADAGDEVGARESLQHALDAYLSGRKEGSLRSTWLEINAVALLSRPEARAIDPAAPEKARELAREVQADAAQQPDDPYTEATIAEACLALGDYEQALRHIRRFAFNPSINVFALNTFHRQLVRLWRLDLRQSPGPEMLALVSAAVLDREDGSIHLSSGAVQRARKVSYEAVFGADRFDSFENYRRGLERCSCVARIGKSADTGVGSGFVLPGRLLSDTLDDRYVLVTNAHVISELDDERQAGALHPTEAVVTFAALEGSSRDKERGIAKVLYSSPRHQLDVVVAELNEPVAPPSCYELAGVLPVASSQAPVRIIGHPSGRGLSLSVNQLLDHDVPKVHYRTATEGGSSGSPVFNQEWKLIGLHHAGGDAVPRLNGHPGTYQANEGIWIGSIREAVQRVLS